MIKFLIFLLIIFAIVLWMNYADNIRRSMDDKSSWIAVPAKIIGTKTIDEGTVVRMGNSKNIKAYDVFPAERVTYVTLEYEVGGRVYHKKVNKKKIGGKTYGSVCIKYLEGKPTYVRFT